MLNTYLGQWLVNCPLMPLALYSCERILQRNVLFCNHAKVVGWSMSSGMKATLVCDALKMAIRQRKLKRDLIVHSDRGSQYANHEYRKLIKCMVMLVV